MQHRQMLSQTSGQIPPLEHHPNMLITLLFLTLIKDLIPLVNNKIKQFLDLDAYHPKSLFTNIEPPFPQVQFNTNKRKTVLVQNGLQLQSIPRLIVSQSNKAFPQALYSRQSSCFQDTNQSLGLVHLLISICSCCFIFSPSSFPKSSLYRFCCF